MTYVVSVGSNSATKGPGQRAGSWRMWSEPYERSIDRPAPTVDTKAASAWAVHPPGERRQALAQRVAVRLSVAELGVLQGFPCDYPWRGGRMEQARQAGNAIPPPLAVAVLAATVTERGSMDTDTLNPEILDLCAGPGGWDQALRMLDAELHARTLGIEWDAAACETREAAGHHTLKADIAEVIASRFVGVKGLIASPPCTLFSQAGSGVGRSVLDLLADAIWRILHGEDCRAEVREAIYPTTRGALDEANAKRRAAGKKPWTEDQVEKRARSDAYIAALVLEPARYIHELGGSLEWLAFEQVPAVLPLWRIYVAALRKQGWSAWCGTLNAADFGVAQTRERAILIARRGAPAQPPEPTHQDGGSEEDLFGASLPPWVSMAEALGWTRGRVGFPRRDDRGDSEDGYRERDWRSTDEPAFALTEKARSWTRQPEGEPEPDASGWAERGWTEPAPTIVTTRRSRDGMVIGRSLPPGESEAVGGWDWRDGEPENMPDSIPAEVTPADIEFVIGGRENATVRTADQPAPTLAFGHRAGQTVWRFPDTLADDDAPDDVEPVAELPEGEFVVNTGRDWKPGGDRSTAQRIPVEQPAPTVDGRGRWWIERVNDQTGSDYDLSWPEDRPATTIATRGLVPHPGSNANRFNGSTKSRNDGLRITEQEAAVLQSFPADYPWRGNRTAVFTQIGNAVPPRLAAHVIAAALGREFM